MQRALIAPLMAMILIPSAEAKTVLLPSKQKSASLASVVAKVEITKSTPLTIGEAECAYEYEAKLLSVKKGSLPRATPFRFGVLGGLEVGKRYVIYLRNIETKSEFVRLMEERTSEPDTARSMIEACPILLPIPSFFRFDRVISE